jgi:anti-anti-sigma factor
MAPEIDCSLTSLVREAIDRLSTAGGALTLDFSAVRRLDPAALRLLEELSARARDHSVQLILGGVNVAVYKVLKLSGLAARFSFLPDGGSPSAN